MRPVSTYVLTCVGTVTDIDKIAQLRRVDLFVLGCDEQAGNPNQLKFRPGDLRTLEVTINEIDRQVERLRDELELQVDFHQPVDQDRTHLLVDVRLRLHVHGSDGRNRFAFAEVVVHVFDVRRNAKRVVLVALVNVVDGTGHLVRGRVGEGGRTTRLTLRFLYHRTRCKRARTRSQGSRLRLVTILHSDTANLRRRALLLVSSAADAGAVAVRYIL
jgi:hypothetical protein